jgi:DNA polymerase-3 subunit beta
LLNDVLKILDNEKISIELSGPLSPCVIKPLDVQDYLYIIMPIRTTDTDAAAA